MNLSLVLIIVMVFIVIPLLMRAIWMRTVIKKPEITKLSESKIEEVNKKAASVADIIMPSSVFLSQPETAMLAITESSVHQRELFAEKIVYITALQDQFFRGYSLLQSLQNAGFSYSHKGLFEYVENGHIVCSVSPVIAPYVFNMAEIGAFVSKALKLQINPVVDEKNAEQIIQKLAEELGGEVQTAPFEKGGNRV